MFVHPFTHIRMPTCLSNSNELSYVYTHAHRHIPTYPHIHMHKTHNETSVPLSLPFCPMFISWLAAHIWAQIQSVVEYKRKKGAKLSGRGIKISTWLASLNGYGDGGLYGNNHGNGEAATRGTGKPVADACKLLEVVDGRSSVKSYVYFRITTTVTHPLLFPIVAGKLCSTHGYLLAHVCSMQVKEKRMSGEGIYTYICMNVPS